CPRRPGNRFSPRAHQPDRAGFDSFRSLGGLTHDQHRLAEGRRLFLYPTRISDDKIGTIHQIDKWQIINRLYKVNVLQTASTHDALYRFLDIGIKMDRVENL